MIGDHVMNCNLAHINIRKDKDIIIVNNFTLLSKDERFIIIIMM